MTRLRSLVLVGLILLSVVAVSPAAAQGRNGYLNPESPQIHPIEVARIDGHDYVLAVNTPDNSLEIWDTDETLPSASRFVMRLAVGLEPVSVRWVPELSRAYVANFLGDSITQIHLGSSDGALGVEATMIGTEQVTDEPLDMAFAMLDVSGVDRPVLFVTHMTLDAIGKYHALSLKPLSPGSERLDAVVDSGADLDFDGAIDDIALKEPRTLAVACDTLFVLGHKGGNTIRYDFDLYREDLINGSTQALAGLGSNNTNMAFGSDGTLYAVGGRARNQLRDEATVAAAATGFVRSMFYVVENPCSSSPRIRARDINRRRFVIQQQPRMALASGMSGGSAVALQPVSTSGPVPFGQALAQPMDLVPFDDASGTKIFFTAFSSDRIGVIEPDSSTAPLNWPLRRIAVAPQSAPIAGPRGLALKPVGDQPDDPGARLYVLNRIDQSITVIDPVTESVVDSFSLHADPTPAHITAGRRFLYDAKLSGNGFVSCSSCHVDSRTDGLAWDLGGGPAVPIPRELMPTGGFSGGLFPGDKEFMVTQSLQGLLNWDVPPSNQKLFTNAPYHWRGDRENFLAFNGAFASLLGGDELSNTDMAAYEDFINSVQYPPNPKQPRNRVHTGILGDPDDNDISDDIDGEGGLLGLKIYHIANSDGVACVSCHSLPEGSNNVLTENISAVNPHPIDDPPLSLDPPQPMETSALRMLFQKEARLDRDGTSDHKDSPITGYEGTMHTGLENATLSPDFNGTASMNAFNNRFFSGRFCNQGVVFCKNLQGVNQFLHEMDTGAGPMIGRAYNVTLQNKNDAATTAAFDDLEQQAKLANAGATAQFSAAAVRRGFWYDLTVQPAVWREEPGGLAVQRQDLLNLVFSERQRLVLQGVPLGSERRVAHPDGAPATQTGPAPAQVALMPMTPNTAYADVPKLSVFWEDPNGNPTFGGTHSHTVRLYQHGILNDGPAGNYGLCSVRHEAPRRFRVAGQELRHGAELHLFIQDDPNGGAPDTTLGPEDAGQVQMLELELPLHPTSDLANDGSPIWETAAELEPMLFLRLMAGRPDQALFPGTMVEITDRDHLFDILIESQAGIFDPPTWNNHFVRVVNADGTQVDGGWQSLSIEPGPDCP